MTHEILIPGHGEVPFPAESPNHGGALIDPFLIVLHSTGGSFEGAYRWMTEKRPTGNVSAHFLVARTGERRQLVSIHHQAWHAGVSMWRGKPNCNGFSIGIELEHLDGQQDWPLVQVKSVALLVRALLGIVPTLNSTAGHCDIAPGRKVDPKDFPWNEYRALVRRQE